MRQLDAQVEGALVRRVQEGDGEALPVLLEAMRGFVYWLAVRHRSPLVELEDLAQAGRVGLVKAIERFDLGRGTRLSTYARPWVEGEIQRTVRESAIIPMPAEKASLVRGIARATEALRTASGRDPSVDDIAD